MQPKESIALIKVDCILYSGGGARGPCLYDAAKTESGLWLGERNLPHLRRPRAFSGTVGGQCPENLTLIIKPRHRVRVSYGCGSTCRPDTGPAISPPSRSPRRCQEEPNFSYQLLLRSLSDGEIWAVHMSRIDWSDWEILRICFPLPMGHDYMSLLELRVYATQTDGLGSRGDKGWVLHPCHRSKVKWAKSTCQRRSLSYLDGGSESLRRVSFFWL